MMRRAGITVAIAVLIAVAFGVASAERSRQVRYVGIHPVAKAEGGGTCYIEGPHVHLYAADKVQYRDHDGWSFFVGDPVAHGYDGPKHAYKGHHPIEVHAVVDDGVTDVEYCYLDGPHFHGFAPPEGPDFKVAGGAHFYVGKPPKAYVDAKPAMVKINAMYAPIAYTRPVVTVEAPAGWIGLHIDVVAPAVVIPVAPTVIIDHHHHHKHKKHKHKKHKKWK